MDAGPVGEDGMGNSQCLCWSSNGSAVYSKVSKHSACLCQYRNRTATIRTTGIGSELAGPGIFPELVIRSPQESGPRRPAGHMGY